MTSAVILLSLTPEFVFCILEITHDCRQGPAQHRDGPGARPAQAAFDI